MAGTSGVRYLSGRCLVEKVNLRESAFESNNPPGLVVKGNRKNEAKAAKNDAPRGNFSQQHKWRRQAQQPLQYTDWQLYQLYRHGNHHPQVPFGRLNSMQCMRGMNIMTCPNHLPMRGPGSQLPYGLLWHPFSAPDRPRHLAVCQSMANHHWGYVIPPPLRRVTPSIHAPDARQSTMPWLQQ